MGYSEIGELFPTFIKSAVGVVIKRREKDMVLYLSFRVENSEGRRGASPGYIIYRKDLSDVTDPAQR